MSALMRLQIRVTLLIFNIAKFSLSLIKEKCYFCFTDEYEEFQFQTVVLKIIHFPYDFKEIITECEVVMYEDECLKPATDYTVRKQTVPNNMSSGN